MQVCVRLNVSETEKIKNKNKILIKVLMKVIKDLQEWVGVSIPVIGTKKNGEMFELKVD